MLPCVALILAMAGSRAFAQTEDFPTIALDAKTVPVGFAGHDPKTLLAQIVAAFGDGKGQFEKSGDAEKRLRTAVEALRFGSLTCRGPFAFAPKAVKTPEYDADSGMATIRVAIDNMHQGTDQAITMRGDDTFVTEEDILKEVEYVAQNSFGVKALVTDEKAYRFGFSIKDPTAKNKGWIGRAGLTYDGLAVTFPMPVAKAKDTLSRLKLLFVLALDPFDPSGRFVENNVFHTKPTLDLPFELDYTNLFVYGTLKSVLVYDPTTGEVVFGHAAKS